jgi:uroporphyrinogen-III decarboxylase
MQETLMPELTSRDRMLRALARQPVDHTPCCFMSFSALRRRVDEDFYRLTEAELALGLDSMLFIPSASRRDRPEHPDLRGLPVRFHSDVTTRTWRQDDSDRGELRREYVTPAGTLSAAIGLSDDWPHGDRLPFVDDYQIPRCIDPLVSGPTDLDALQYLLQPPAPEDADAFHHEAARAHAFVREKGVLLAGGWGVGLDMANWLCGTQNLIILMLEQPDFVAELLGMIHAWNLNRMEMVLSAPVDLYIRRAWYEGCDFVTPRAYERLVLPHLAREAALAHAHGARFGLICSSGLAPILDYYADAGVDVLIGIDPIQGTHTDMAQIKARIGERICLWGGVSGAVTVEMGTEEAVRAAVRTALRTLGPRGHILAPVDNITVDAPQTWRNLDVLIETWRREW